MFFECVFTCESEQFDYYRVLVPAVFKQHAFASKGEFRQFIVPRSLNTSDYDK